MKSAQRFNWCVLCKPNSETSEDPNLCFPPTCLARNTNKCKQTWTLSSARNSTRPRYVQSKTKIKWRKTIFFCRWICHCIAFKLSSFSTPKAIVCWPNITAQKVTHKANQKSSLVSKNKKPLKKVYGKRRRKWAVRSFVIGFFFSFWPLLLKLIQATSFSMTLILSCTSILSMLSSTSSLVRQKMKSWCTPLSPLCRTPWRCFCVTH